MQLKFVSTFTIDRHTYLSTYCLLLLCTTVVELKVGTDTECLQRLKYLLNGPLLKVC